MKALKIQSKTMDEEFKCGGCNWVSLTAWYLEGDPEPKMEPGADRRITSGLCASCFLDMLESSNAKVVQG